MLTNNLNFEQGNPTVLNKEKAELLFPDQDKVREIKLIVEAKGDSLITL